MRYIFLILGIFLIFPANADSSGSLGGNFRVHLLSDHSKPGDYNERNLGIGLEFDYPDGYWRVTIGGYENSHGDSTTYFGPMFGTDHVAIGAVFLHGYDRGLDADRLWPSPAPVLRIRPLSTKISPSFIVAPMSNGYVVLTSLDWRFE